MKLLVPQFTLPIPVTDGGTGTSTQFTTGSIIFAGTNGVYTQDNASFFWDDTNNRLGLGTASPLATFHVQAGGSSNPSFAAGISGIFSRTSGVSNLAIVAANTGASNLYFSDTDSENPGYIQYDHTSNFMRYIVNAAEVARFTSAGELLLGATTPLTVATASVSTSTPTFQLQGTTASDAATLNARFSSGNAAASTIFARSRSASLGVNTTVQDTDFVGNVTWTGADGTGYVEGARIRAVVDGTPATGTVPMRLDFLYAGAGDTAATNMGLTIRSDGNTAFGGSTPLSKVTIIGNNSGATEANTLTFQDSDTTTQANQQLGRINFYSNDASAPGAGVKAYILCAAEGVAPQVYISFATDVASGTPIERMRINSDGGVSVGTTTATAGMSLEVKRDISGAGTSIGIRSNGTVQSTVTTGADGFRSNISTAAAAFTLTALRHYIADQGTIGATSAITSQYGFLASNSLTGATNNYGFYSDIPAAANRWNFYAGDTAQNYFAGNVGIGITVPNSLLQVGGTVSATRNLQVDSSGRMTIRYDDNSNQSILTLVNRAITGVGQGTSILFQIADTAAAGINAGRISVVSENTTYASTTADASMTFSTVADAGIGERMRIDSSGRVGIGQTSPTAVLHLKAGTATANTAPIKLTSGTLLTAPEAGVLEFLTDSYYATTTTNAVRRMLVAGSTGRATAQTAAVASVATYTLGATDATFEVSANVLVTTATVHSFNVTVAYTDEGNTARTLTLNFSTLAGVISNAAIGNAGGAVPYEGIPTHIRCKASTAITIATTGTFTTVTYNVEGVIKQVA